MSNSVSLDVTKSLIEKQVCFSEFTSAEVEILASLMAEKHFAPGDIIVTEGDPVDCVYIIVEGITEVRCVKFENLQPHMVYVATLKEGDAIGLNETGFFSLSGKRTATVVAITEVTTLCLSVAEFHGFTLANTHANTVMRAQEKNIKT